MLFNRLGFMVGLVDDGEYNHALLEVQTKLSEYNSVMLAKGEPDTNIVIQVTFRLCDPVLLWLSEYKEMVNYLTKQDEAPTVLGLEALWDSYDTSLPWSEVEEWMAYAYPYEEDLFMEEYEGEQPFKVYADYPSGQVSQDLVTGQFSKVGRNPKPLSTKEAMQLIMAGKVSNISPKPY